MIFEEFLLPLHEEIQVRAENGKRRWRETRPINYSPKREPWPPPSGSRGPVPPFAGSCGPGVFSTAHRPPTAGSLFPTGSLVPGVSGASSRSGEPCPVGGAAGAGAESVPVYFRVGKRIPVTLPFCKRCVASAAFPPPPLGLSPADAPSRGRRRVCRPHRHGPCVTAARAGEG